MTTAPSTDQRPIRVGIVDDQPLLVSAFQALVDHQSDMEVVATAGDGAEALTVCETAAIDVLLLDVRMPRLDGIETTRRLAARDAGPRILILTTFDLDEYVLGALGAGASGYLLKDTEPDRLLEAIRAVHRGEAVIASAAAPVLLSRLREAERVPAAAPVSPGSSDAQRLIGQLTPRERDVLTLIGAGATNGEIAARLFIAETTVKTHVGSLLLKLEARDRVALVILAQATGIAAGAEQGRD